MGFYSYICAKTYLPVMNFTSCRIREMFEIVVLFPDGSTWTGEYDGYGHAAGLENIADAMDQGRLKWVLKKFYAGEKFEDLGPSHNDPGQGHFYDQSWLAKAYAKGGFQSYAEFLRWYDLDPTLTDAMGSIAWKNQ